MQFTERGAILSVMAQHPKRPRDPNQLAHMIVGIATSDTDPVSARDANKDPLAIKLGRRGGLKGGRARAETLTPERRTVIARQAAAKRWSKQKT